MRQSFEFFSYFSEEALACVPIRIRDICKKNSAVCCYRPCLNIAVKWFERLSKAVLRIRIRIHQIQIFLGFLDPDPSIIKQK
jgi:hypothetical protein